jgi:hypothetical protein
MPARRMGRRCCELASMPDELAFHPEALLEANGVAWRSSGPALPQLAWNGEVNFLV